MPVQLKQFITIMSHLAFRLVCQDCTPGLIGIHYILHKRSTSSAAGLSILSDTMSKIPGPWLVIPLAYRSLYNDVTGPIISHIRFTFQHDP